MKTTYLSKTHPDVLSTDDYLEICEQWPKELEHSKYGYVYNGKRYLKGDIKIPHNMHLITFPHGLTCSGNLFAEFNQETQEQPSIHSWGDLEISGDISSAELKVNGKIYSGKRISARSIDAEGCIVARNEIDSLRSIHSNSNICAGTGIQMNKHGGISAGGDIRCGGWVYGENWVSAGGNMHVGSLNCCGRVSAVGSINVGGGLSGETLETKNGSVSVDDLSVDYSVSIKGSLRVRRNLKVFASTQVSGVIACGGKIEFYGPTECMSKIEAAAEIVIKDSVSASSIHPYEPFGTKNERLVALRKKFYPEKFGHPPTQEDILREMLLAQKSH